MNALPMIARCMRHQQPGGSGSEQRFETARAADPRHLPPSDRGIEGAHALAADPTTGALA